MSNKKTHGGRREGSGRKRVDFSLIIKVGQAYMRLEQLEYEAQKRAMLEDKTNLKEFYDYINDIPLDKRKAFVGSDDHIDHSKAIDRELTESKIKRPSDSGRLIRVTKSHNSSTRIRNEVAEAFGLSAVQVKNYLQLYRAFLRDQK
jgi:isopropylmalate/homocitrate/citramalate synthase